VELKRARSAALVNKAETVHGRHICRHLSRVFGECFQFFERYRTYCLIHARIHEEVLTFRACEINPIFPPWGDIAHVENHCFRTCERLGTGAQRGISLKESFTLLLSQHEPKLLGILH